MDFLAFSTANSAPSALELARDARRTQLEMWDAIGTWLSRQV